MRDKTADLDGTQSHEGSGQGFSSPSCHHADGRSLLGGGAVFWIYQVQDVGRDNFIAPGQDALICIEQSDARDALLRFIWKALDL
jgi:hypothetical protein